MYTAQIPTALVKALEIAGMARVITTEMAGRVATEIQFSAAAIRYIVPFFSTGGK